MTKYVKEFESDLDRNFMEKHKRKLNIYCDQVKRVQDKASGGMFSASKVKDSDEEGFEE